MIVSVRAPMFAPLPGEVRRAADHCAAVCLDGQEPAVIRRRSVCPAREVCISSDTPAAGYGAISGGKIELAKKIGLI